LQKSRAETPSEQFSGELRRFLRSGTVFGKERSKAAKHGRRNSKGEDTMLDFNNIDLRQIFLAAVGALMLTVTSIGVTVAPAQASPSCFSILDSSAGQELICSHA
jgi:hypothetical protein